MASITGQLYDAETENWINRVTEEWKANHKSKAVTSELVKLDDAVYSVELPVSGIVVRHRVIVSVLLVVTMAALYAIEYIIWPHSAKPHGVLQEIWSWLGLLWVTAFIPAFLELIGMYMWKAPKNTAKKIPNFVCWRYVSYGINIEALSASIKACRAAMKETPLFPYVIEVVMDNNTSMDSLPEAGGDLHYIIVPKSYETPNGTLAKARALNYALENSPLADDAYIWHCDEETWPTKSVIIGTASMISEEEAKLAADPQYIPRVGQGMISYHRKWSENIKLTFFTLSDCIRTGSDVGRLYLSMAIGVPLFGLHGSFIVIKNSVEKMVGFDIGPVGSLTEDAWVGTMMMDRGIRCRWVDGYAAEQCTERISDFIKQRGRWFNGLVRTSLHAPASLKWRVVLIISMLVWASAPFAWFYTIGHLIAGGYVGPDVRALANFSLAVYIATTLVGLRFNMKEHGIVKYSQKVRWALTWLACLLPLTFLESFSVAKAIIRPAKTFHVVKK